MWELNEAYLFLFGSVMIAHSNMWAFHKDLTWCTWRNRLQRDWVQ
jgi:hypothetical protein